MINNATSCLGIIGCNITVFLVNKSKKDIRLFCLLSKQKIISIKSKLFQTNIEVLLV